MQRANLPVRIRPRVAQMVRHIKRGRATGRRWRRGRQPCMRRLANDNDLKPETHDLRCHRFCRHLANAPAHIAIPQDMCELPLSDDRPSATATFVAVVVVPTSRARCAPHASTPIAALPRAQPQSPSHILGGRRFRRTNQRPAIHDDGVRVRPTHVDADAQSGSRGVFARPILLSCHSHASRYAERAVREPPSIAFPTSRLPDSLRGQILADDPAEDFDPALDRLLIGERVGEADILSPAAVKVAAGARQILDAVRASLGRHRD